MLNANLRLEEDIVELVKLCGSEQGLYNKEEKLETLHRFVISGTYARRRRLPSVRLH